MEKKSKRRASPSELPEREGFLGFGGADYVRRSGKLWGGTSRTYTPGRDHGSLKMKRK